MISVKPVRVLIVDNSIFFRRELSEGLFHYLPAGSLVENAANPMEAMEKLRLFAPAVVIVNVSMSATVLEGKYFFPLMKEKGRVPIIAYGLLPEAKDAAIRAGATDYVVKPSDSGEFPAFFRHILTCVWKDLESRPSHGAVHSAVHLSAPTTQRLQPGAVMTRAGWRAAHGNSVVKEQPSVFAPPKAEIRPRLTAETHSATAPKVITQNPPAVIPQHQRGKITLIAVGSSTGGTEALSTVFKELRPPLPGIVVAQHIPAMFAKLFADRLNTECALTVKEGEDGEIVKPNTIYIAPGNKHMIVTKSGQGYMIKCHMGPRVHSCRPSVDVLFDSVAENVGGSALGVILTGMGQDGADGLLRMRRQGSPTLGQDEATCVVYGMPRIAWEKGAVEKQLPLNMIAGAITQIARE